MVIFDDGVVQQLAARFPPKEEDDLEIIVCGVPAVPFFFLNSFFPFFFFSRVWTPLK